jgi:sec-independent protein translocase protein TatA
MRMQEVLLILLAVLLLFGATRLPQLGSALGKAIRNFKQGFSDDEPEGSAGQTATRNLEGSSTAGSSTERAKDPVASKDR